MKLKLSYPLSLSIGKEQQEQQQQQQPQQQPQQQRVVKQSSSTHHHHQRQENSQHQQELSYRESSNTSEARTSSSATTTSIRSQTTKQNSNTTSKQSRIVSEEVSEVKMMTSRLTPPPSTNIKNSRIGTATTTRNTNISDQANSKVSRIVSSTAGENSNNGRTIIVEPVPVKTVSNTNKNNNLTTSRRQVSSGSRTMNAHHPRRRSRVTNGNGGGSLTMGRTFSTSESSLSSAAYGFHYNTNGGATPSVCSVSTHGSSDVTSLASSILNSPRGYARGAGSQYPYPTHLQVQQQQQRPAPLPPTIEIAVPPQPEQQRGTTEQQEHREVSTVVTNQDQQLLKQKQPVRTTNKKKDLIDNNVLLPPLPPLRFTQTYDLCHSVGCNKGAFSTVWKGIHKSSSMPVAIKMIKRNALTPKEDKAVFNEVALLQKLQEEHPRNQDASLKQKDNEENEDEEEGGIIEVYDFFVTDHTFYIITEYMDGGDLMDLLTQCGRFLEDEICNVIYSLVKSIHYMHNTCNVAHRDLKPENLLLGSKKYKAPPSSFKTNQVKNNDKRTSSSSSNGRHVFGETMEIIKIADFGLASNVIQPRSLVERCGTPMYVAPEVLRGTPYDQSCDMWSLGVIVYYLLSGCPPFYDRTSKQSLYKKILKGHVVLDGDGWDTISPEAKHFIASCLIVNPRGRMKSSEAIHHPWFASLLR